MISKGLVAVLLVDCASCTSLQISIENFVGTQFFTLFLNFFLKKLKLAKIYVLDVCTAFNIFLFIEILKEVVAVLSILP
jgi:hypothetical protein